MQRSELETEIGYLLGDPSHDRWPLSLIRSRIEFAQTEVQALTGAVRSTDTITPVADTPSRAYTSDFIDIVRVIYYQPDGTGLPLIGRMQEDLDFYHPNWRNEPSGLPTEFYVNFVDKYITMHPTPSAEYATGASISIRGVPVPDELTADDSEPFNGNQAMQVYAMSIVYWVVAQCWQDDGTPEALSKARYYRTGTLDQPGMYEKEIIKINKNYSAQSVMPSRIMWKPEGGRIGGTNWPTKSNPLGW